MTLTAPQQLRYRLTYGGHSAGEQRLTLEPRREGMRLTLEASVEMPQPRTRQRWESELDKEGVPRRYRERVEGGGSRLMEVEFSKADGLVSVRQGREEFSIPYLAEMHDPLSLILAVGSLSLEVGQVKMFAMVGGRAYAERLSDQTRETPEGEQSLKVYRLRPGLSLLYFDPEGYPVRLTQKVGEHVFEAELEQIQEVDARQLRESKEAREPREPRPQGREPGPGGRERSRIVGRNSSRGEGSRPRVVSGEPPAERGQQNRQRPQPQPSQSAPAEPQGEGKEKTGESSSSRRRRRRRRYS
ncbi:MAG: DUF3108 domain-containing protein [Meiothermus sp.]|nr:DUF3108 domain-containing protein [Meiothermus sp.]